MNEFCVKSGYVGSYSFFFFFVFVKLFPSRKGPSLDILVCMLEVDLGERWFSCCKNITSKGVLWKISQTWESRANYEFWCYLNAKFSMGSSNDKLQDMRSFLWYVLISVPLVEVGGWWGRLQCGYAPYCRMHSVVKWNDFYREEYLGISDLCTIPEV